MERTGGIWQPLGVAAVYTSFQNLLGAKVSRQRIVTEFLDVAEGDKFLDIGCGPADILAFLPRVDYLGLDLSERYVSQARAQFGTKGRFEVADVGDPSVVPADSFDMAHGGGLLHHLDDITCKELMRKVETSLRPGGRAVFVDPAWEPRQNILAKTLISLDRGLHVRDAAGYAKLAGTAFNDVKTHIVRDSLRLPYTHCVTVCRKRTTPP